MIRKFLLLAALVSAFGCGFAFNSILNSDHPQPTEIKRVTGIGGIFFKCNDPKAVNEWYRSHLGIDVTPYGATFEWREATDSTQLRQTQWSTFPQKTEYFAPSKKDFMINYTVDDLEALVMELRKENVTILDTMETFDFGKFIHIMDIEGNKIQLWEPADE